MFAKKNAGKSGKSALLNKKEVMSLYEDLE